MGHSSRSPSYDRWSRPYRSRSRGASGSTVSQSDSLAKGTRHADSRRSRSRTPEWHRHHRAFSSRSRSRGRDSSRAEGSYVSRNRRHPAPHWRASSRSSSGSPARRRRTFRSCSRGRRRALSRSLSGGRRGSQDRRRPAMDHHRDAEERRVRRRREDAEAVNRKMEHYKEPPSTTVIVLRQVPPEVTEQDLETAVRSAAISLGFSPPNFVKLVAPQTSATTTSAFVDFPSSDSAQVFYDACRRDFSVKAKRIFLQLPRCPAASIALLSPTHSAEEWAAVIDLAESHHRPVSADSEGPLGPGIPLPNMDDFVMDRKSGLLFNEKMGFFFDAQTQQYISASGICYVKSGTTSRTLVPVYKMPGALNSVTTATSVVLNNAKAALNSSENQRASRSGQDKEEQEDSVEAAAAVTVDSAVTKATAVASVLAAAQLAAKATKRVVKPKLLEGSALQSVTGTVANSENDSTSAGARSATDAPEPPTIEALFGDVPLEEVRPEENSETQHNSTASDAGGNVDQEGTNDLGTDKNKTAASLTTPPSPVKPCSSLLMGPGLFAQQHICFVCIQRFETAEHLAKHETDSLFHKKNCKIQGIERIAAS